MGNSERFSEWGLLEGPCIGGSRLRSGMLPLPADTLTHTHTLGTEPLCREQLQAKESQRALLEQSLRRTTRALRRAGIEIPAGVVATAAAPATPMTGAFHASTTMAATPYTVGTRVTGSRGLLSTPLPTPRFPGFGAAPASVAALAAVAKTAVAPNDGTNSSFAFGSPTGEHSVRDLT